MTCWSKSGNFWTMVTGCPEVRLTPYIGAVVLYVDLGDSDISQQYIVHDYFVSLAEARRGSSNNTPRCVFSPCSAEKSSVTCVPVRLEKTLLGHAGVEG